MYVYICEEKAGVEGRREDWLEMKKGDDKVLAIKSIIETEAITHYLNQNSYCPISLLYTYIISLHHYSLWDHLTLFLYGATPTRRRPPPRHSVVLLPFSLFLYIIQNVECSKVLLNGEELYDHLWPKWSRFPFSFPFSYISILKFVSIYLFYFQHSHV